MGRRHHLVSQAYQRLFADGKQIRLIWKDSWESKLIGTRDAFAREDFHTTRTPTGANDALEDEWARIESLILPGIAPLLTGQHTPEADLAGKALMALHWARSAAVELVHGRILAAQTDEQAAQMPEDPRFRTAFLRDFAREPLAGELEAMVRASMAAIEDERVEFVEAMARFHTQALEYFQQFHLQLATVHPQRIGLLYGDNPVVLRQGLRVGVHHGVGLKSADLIYLPLGRWVALSLTKSPGEDGMVSPIGVQQLNNLMRRNCIAHLAAHPAEDWRRGLALPRLV